MNQVATTETKSRQLTPIESFRTDLTKMSGQFAMALPAHIPVERFHRVVMTAIQNNPKLLKCTRQSLFNACMKAASDGLLPDGREGAIVPFSENEDGRKAAENASWMPMIGGIRKKARNSGEITDWYAEVVHEGDHYIYRRGENPLIEHTPSPGGRKRKIIAAYSVAHLKDGGISREWMWIEEIEEVRDRYSRSKKGPWSDPVAFPEMCKKTVARLHSKVLPSSTDLDDLMRRDDELYNLKGERPKPERPAALGTGVKAALQHFGNGQEAGQDFTDPRPGDNTVIDQDTGEVIEHQQQGSDVANEAGESPAEAFIRLVAMAGKHPPKDPEHFANNVDTLIDAAKEIGGKAGADALTGWWSSAEARTLRNKAGMTAEDTAGLTAGIAAAVKEMQG